MAKDKKNSTDSRSSIKDFGCMISGLISTIFTNIRNFFGKISGNGTSNLRTRIVSSVILILIAIIAIYFSLSLFFLLVTICTILMTFEWIDLTKTAKGDDAKKWRLIGLFYISIPVASTLILHNIEPDIILWMFFIIWTTDIFAYFAGKNIGGPKLAPNISPNKTWSGLIGGVIASMVIGFISSFVFVTGNIVFFTIFSGILAVIEQCSDLLESKFKRIFGVKDSSAIIPGHGGVLDRLDGLIITAPTVLIVYCFFQDKFIVIN